MANSLLSQLAGKTSLRHRLFIFVFLPAAIFSFYYSVIASDMYISEARFSVRGAEVVGGSDLLSFLGKGSSSTTVDGYIVQDFMLSADMLKILEERCEFSKHYQDSSADFISRLSKNPTKEGMLDYFRKVTEISFDTTSGILTLRIRAYDRDKARQLTQTILSESELLVNKLNERALNDALALSRSELGIAEERLTAARETLRKLRNKTEIISPEAAAASFQNLIAGLEVESAKARTQLSEAKTYMRDDSPQVISLKARVAALGDQIARERSRLAGNNGRAITDTVSEFERHNIEHQFAQNQYQSALASIEAARIRAGEKSRYLVTFEGPTLADESRYPERLLFSSLAFAGFSLIYSISALIFAAIREHIGV